VSKYKLQCATPSSTLAHIKYFIYQTAKIFISPPENEDLCFSADVLFFLQREISEVRGPTGLKFCTMVSTRSNFIMPVQNFGGHTRKKISGAKNMQNLARFRTTSKFSSEYLGNGWRYSKSDSHSVYRDFSCVRRNKSGEVWSSDLGDLDVKSYPPKAHFSEKIFRPLGGAALPNFYAC